MKIEVVLSARSDVTVYNPLDGPDPISHIGDTAEVSMTVPPVACSCWRSRHEPASDHNSYPRLVRRAAMLGTATTDMHAPASMWRA